MHSIPVKLKTSTQTVYKTGGYIQLPAAVAGFDQGMSDSIAQQTKYSYRK